MKEKKQDKKQHFKRKRGKGRDYFSVSSLRTYVECPKMYHFRYVLNVKEPEIPEYLHFGSVIHEALAALYEGRDVRRVFMRAISRNKDKVRWYDSYESSRLDGWTLLYYYIKNQYHIEPLEVEKEILVEVKNPFNPKEKLPLKMMAVIDVVDKRDIIIDHKVVTTPFTKDEAERKTQATAYWIAFEEHYVVQE